MSQFFGVVSRKPKITTCRGEDVDIIETLDRSLSSKIGMYFSFQAKNLNAIRLLPKPVTKLQRDETYR